MRITNVKIDRNVKQIFVYVYTTQLAILIANKEKNLKEIEKTTTRYYERKVFTRRPRYTERGVIIIKPELVRNCYRDAQ